MRLYQHEGGNVTLLSTRVTDGNGFYSFNKLCAGNYSLKFIPPPGYVFTLKNQGDPDEDSDVDPTTGRTDKFYLGYGEYNPTIDAGLYYSPLEQVPVFTRRQGCF